MIATWIEQANKASAFLTAGLKVLQSTFLRLTVALQTSEEIVRVRLLGGEMVLTAHGTTVMAVGGTFSDSS